MKKIDRKRLKIKNLIGIIDNPTHEDLLFEIVDFLENERRFDGRFIKQEVKDKTRCRIESDILEDLQVLCDLGYLKKGKWTYYHVINHPWEIKNEK